MAKKKAAAKKKASSEPSASDMKNAELLKRFMTGYQKRLAEQGQPGLVAVETAAKTSLKEFKSFNHVVIDGEEMAGFAHSRFEPFLVGIRETGYPFLAELHLWNLTLSHMDVQQITYHIETRLDLTVFEMLHCTVDDGCYSLLGQAMCNNTSITTLEIGFQPISTLALKSLLLGLTRNQTLRTLKITRCQLQPDVGEIFFPYVCAVRLDVLDLTGNQLGPVGFQAIAQLLPHCQTLSKLILCDNGIEYLGGGEDRLVAAMEAFGQYLKGNSTISVVDLSQNTIGDAAGQILLGIHQARKESKLPGVKVPVGHRMGAELFAGLMAAGKSASASKGKKKGGKKKKKK
eukprot:m.111940 g.111940  ORF g.111940 m.111940 type:complete len:345 (+) comp13468_c0_seq8:309-1343(+)